MGNLSWRPSSLLQVAIEGRTGKADDDDDNADVDDVATVTSVLRRVSSQVPRGGCGRSDGR